MKLELNRPLAFIDLETTGLDIGKDRIVEVSIIKVMIDGSKEIKTLLVNPEIPIPPEVSAIHGKTNADVSDCPTFKEVANELNFFLENCDLAGYNSNSFDIPLLIEEFIRAGISFSVDNRKLVDVKNIYHKMEPRTLTAAYKYYCSKDLGSQAHRAEDDCNATYEILMAQIEKYEILKNDLDFLYTFSTDQSNVDLNGRIVYNEKRVEVFNFGKHKGRTVEEVFLNEPSYYSWIINADFPQSTKGIVTGLWNKMIAKRNKK